MVGAVVGNPGTNPTNWTSTAVAGNITAKEIVAIGTENGINYIDVRYTTNGAATFNVFTFESTTQVVAANGQTWTSSAYVKLVGGSLSNLTLANRIIYRTSAGANVTSNDLAFVPTTAALSTQQSTNTFTASGATIERITNSILATASGTSDFTLRIGMPQLEQGAFATSVIATTAAAATRNADVASVNTLTPWFNAVESTLSFEFTPVGMKSVGGTALVSIDNGSNERIALIAASNNGMQNITTVAGVTSANTSSPSTIYAANTTYKVAFAVKLNDAQSFSGGVAGTVTTTALMPSGLTALQFNKTYASATSNNGWIRRFAYYPRRLSSAEGIAITT